MTEIALSTEYGSPIDFDGVTEPFQRVYSGKFPSVAPESYTRIGLALDEYNDLALTETGGLAMAYDSLAVGQHVAQRLHTFAGEWFLDTTCGVPWLEQILGRQFDAELAESVVKKEVLDTDGVTGIDAFSLRFESSQRRIDYRQVGIVTEYDEATE